MEFICSQCKVKLSVPNEKIPKDKEVTLTCPKCSNRIIVGHNNKNHNAELQNFSNKSQNVSNGNKYEDFILHHNYDIPIALLLCSSTENQDLLKKTASTLGFRYHTADTEQDAVLMISLNDFNLIVMCEGFCSGSSFSGSPVLKQISLMKPSSRRECFVALIGEDMTTNDRIKAFVLNVNLVVSNKDMEHVDSILNSSLKENEKFYSVFMIEKEKVYSA